MNTKLIAVAFAFCCVVALVIADGYGYDDHHYGKHYDGKAEVYMKKKPYGFDYHLKEYGHSYGGHGGGYKKYGGGGDDGYKKYGGGYDKKYDDGYEKKY